MKVYFFIFLTIILTSFGTKKTNDVIFFDQINFKMGSKNNSLDNYCSIGDLIVFESTIMCSGCVPQLQPIFNKLKTIDTVFVMSNQITTQGMQYRLNDWSSDQTKTFKGIKYEYCNLADYPSPFIIVRVLNGYLMFPQNIIFANHNNLKKSTIKSIKNATSN